MSFTVIDNPSTAPGSAFVAPRPIETGNALALLTDRQFHVSGVNMREEAAFIHPNAGGAFLAGDTAPAYLPQIRAANPGLPLIIEPRAMHKHWASAAEPFQFAPSALSLDDDLDQQRRLSDLALTPTGQIRKGDSAALKAALVETNKLNRTDTLFTIPASAGWLSDTQLVKQLIAVINRSNHPVLLAFTDATNPVGSMVRARAY